MSINQGKKADIVKEISDSFEKSDTFYLLDFVNLPVSKSMEFRKQLRQNSCSFKVVKNRLALKALKDRFPENLKEHFKGPTAIAFSSEDPIGLAKLIMNFSTMHKVLNVKAGIVEGQFLASERFDEIANINSREDLLSRIGFMMAYPLMKLLRTWQAPFQNLGSMLSQLKIKK